MTNYISRPQPEGLFKLAGKISNYRKERATASFVFTETDQTKMGVVAIASAAAGLHGQAAIMSSNASSMEEEADFVEFMLDGKQVRGWLWRSPFKEGDVVEAAVEKQGAGYELFGMIRPEDRVIALYPHCSRGKGRHVRNAIKWWGILMVFFYIITLLVPILGGEFAFWEFWHELLSKEPRVWFMLLGMAVFFMIMVASLTRKWMPFVRLAENVFRALDLPHPSEIDLVKSSKAQCKDADPPECGTLYFRY